MIRKVVMQTADGYQKADWSCPRCNETNYKGERWCFFCRLDAEKGWRCDRCSTKNGRHNINCSYCGDLRED